MTGTIRLELLLTSGKEKTNVRRLAALLKHHREDPFSGLPPPNLLMGANV
jgi:hypothetical protein